MRKKINAFTLVELLAVIVILAIILVIAVPKITKVIEQSKKGALESSAKLIASSLETKYKEELALGTDGISTSTEKTCPDSMYDSTLYSCTYTLDSDTGKATVSLIGKTGSKFENLGVDSTTTEAISYKLGEAITITFDSQGGSTVESKTLTSGEAYGDLTTPTKSGVSFKGWYTDATGGTKVISTDIAKSSITLYAHYVEPVELSSSWKDILNEKVVDGVTITISETLSDNNIKKIKFYDNSDNVYNTTGKTFIANVSTEGETIKAYGVVDSADSTMIDIDIVGDSLIAFPSDSSYLFNLLSNLNTLDFNNSITTVNVTNIAGMFCNCSSLTSLNMSSFDTSNVTNMQNMFCVCSSLTSLDLSSFDTSNVTDMSWMFKFCSSLTSIDLSNFNTSNVTNMSRMFYDCSSLISLNVKKFDTSKVTDMIGMFYNCSSLTTLDVSNFDTQNVVKFGGTYTPGFEGGMFEECSNLTNLDLSNFNTSKATDISRMFCNCSSLISLNISSFDTSNVTNMSYMFWGCINLTSLDVSNFNTNNVTAMTYMFYNCSALTSLDVSNFNMNNVTSIYGIFNDCSKLTSLTIPATNGNGISNDSFRIYGSRSSVLYVISISGCEVTLK